MSDRPGVSGRDLPSPTIAILCPYCERIFDWVPLGNAITSSPTPEPCDCPIGAAGPWTPHRATCPLAPPTMEAQYIASRLIENAALRGAPLRARALAIAARVDDELLSAAPTTTWAGQAFTELLEGVSDTLRALVAEHEKGNKR